MQQFKLKSIFWASQQSFWSFLFCQLFNLYFITICLCLFFSSVCCFGNSEKTVWEFCCKINTKIIMEKMGITYRLQWSKPPNNYGKQRTISTVLQILETLETLIPGIKISDKYNQKKLLSEVLSPHNLDKKCQFMP